MTTRKQLIQKLDRLARAELFSREPNKCVTCKYWRRPTATEGLQLGHFITRTKAGTRWDKTNCHIQCAFCNINHEHNAYPYTQYMLDTYGREEVDKLQLRSWSREGRPFTITELREMIQQQEGEPPR